MPIPNRQAGEERDDFITRCIEQISDEYSTKQASAICYAQLHDSFKYEKGGQMTPDDITS